MRIPDALKTSLLFPRYWNRERLALPTAELWEALAHLFFPPVCYYCKAPLDSRGRQKLCPKCRESLTLTEAPYCLGCSKIDVSLDEETLLCPDCQAKSKRAPLSRVIAGAAYTGLAPHLVSKFKYGNARYLADPLTDIITSHPEFNVLSPYIYALVPVPMHWAKRLIRGYNQAEDLAYELSRRTKIPVVKALKRTRYQSPQASLTREARMSNLGGAFQFDKRYAACFQRQPKHMITAVIDDVCTTCTTAELCARQLKTASAKNIILLTVAKT